MVVKSILTDWTIIMDEEMSKEEFYMLKRGGWWQIVDLMNFGKTFKVSWCRWRMLAEVY